ncbi:MAG: ABC transporter ATP-binding protein [Solirubrobacterales bacterium]
MTGALLEVDELSKRFRVRGRRRKYVHAVNGVSFDLRRGETLGLVGESGSGKTTVGRCVLGLERPTDGSIRFHGTDIAGLGRRGLRSIRQRIQIVFQEPYDSLDPRLRLGDSIALPLKAAGEVGRKERSRRVSELAELMGLEQEDLRCFPHELSAGQLQRAGVARAMATEPEVIVLDEPTSLLDVSVRATVVALLRDVQRKAKVAFIFISHDLTAVRHISDRVAVMYLGRIVEVAPTEEIFAAPRHPYTKALLSAVLLPELGARKDRYRLAGEIPSPIDLPVGCSLCARCPVAIEACGAAPPRLAAFSPGHRVACIRAGEPGWDAGEKTLGPSAPTNTATDPTPTEESMADGKR